MANSTPTVDLEAEEELYQRAFSKERNELLALKDRYITVTLHNLEKVTRYFIVTAKLELVLERVTFRFVSSHYCECQYATYTQSLNKIGS